MLLETILDPLFWLISTMLNLIPTFEVSDSVVGSFSVIFSLLSSVGYFFPLDTFVSVVSVALAFYAVIFTVSAVNWLIGKIPTIN